MREAPIYLDHNATTPVDPRVVDAMLPYFSSEFGNPSSAHALGRRASDAIERARAQVAVAIGATPDDIVFTSGGSEGSNTVFGSFDDPPTSLHAITTAVEHPATLVPLRRLAARGATLEILPVDRTGRVDAGADISAPPPCAGRQLLSIMHANNEVGTIQPVGALARRVREAGGRVHVDAAQTVGKVPVDVDALAADYVTIAAHKFCGPKGVGALYVRGGAPLRGLVLGAAHERGRRAGTENVALIVGLGTAIELATGDIDDAARRSRRLSATFVEHLSAAAPGLVVHGPTNEDERLPNTTSVALPGVDAARLVREVGDVVAMSQGAACHADGVVSSDVLAAMGVPTELHGATVRVSVGRTTTERDVVEAVAAIRAQLKASG